MGWACTETVHARDPSHTRTSKQATCVRDDVRLAMAHTRVYTHTETQTCRSAGIQTRAHIRTNSQPHLRMHNTDTHTHTQEHTRITNPRHAETHFGKHTKPHLRKKICSHFPVVILAEVQLGRMADTAIDVEDSPTNINLNSCPESSSRQSHQCDEEIPVAQLEPAEPQHSEYAGPPAMEALKLREHGLLVSS